MHVPLLLYKYYRNVSFQYYAINCYYSMLNELMATHEEVTSAQSEKLKVMIRYKSKLLEFIIPVTQEREEITVKKTNR